MRVAATEVTTADTFDGVPVEAVAVGRGDPEFVWIYWGDGCHLRCRREDTVEVDERKAT